MGDLDRNPSSAYRWLNHINTQCCFIIGGGFHEVYSLYPFCLEIWQKNNDMHQRNIKSMMWKIDTMYMFLMLQIIVDESERDPRQSRPPSEQGCDPRLSHQGWPQVPPLIIMHFINTCLKSVCVHYSQSTLTKIFV